MDESTDWKPLVPLTEEAFATVALRNNYFAWLLEAKEKLKGNLVTDYDKPSLIKNKKNINVTLVKREFDVLENMYPDHEDKPIVVFKEGDTLFSDMQKATAEALKDLRDSISQDERTNYTEVLEALGAANTTDDTKERIAKRRKVIKGLRRYTTPKDGEAKFKGWSPRAATDMVWLRTMLKKCEGNMALFGQAYRQVYRERNEPNRREEKKDGKVPEETVKELWGIVVERVEV